MAGSAGGSWGGLSRPVLWTTDALRFGLAHLITSSYNSACNQAGALGPIAGRPFNPLKVTDDGAGEDTTGSKTTGTYNIWCLELHFAGGGTALGRPGNLFLGFLRGDNVDKVATGRLSMIMDIVRSVKRTLATCVERLDSRALIGTLRQTTVDLVAELMSSARSKPFNHPTPHTGKATASQVNKPVDQRTKQVKRNYKRRTTGLDQKYAPEVVGDGTNGQVGPFETALGEFCTGNVFPIVVGAFGEVNEDMSKLFTKLARLTAKTDFGKSMSPLVATAGKGAHSPSFMQFQFRRALGYLIARGQAQHLLKRRHYARPSAREAYQTAEDNHSKHRTRPRASMSGYARWWQNVIPEGYGLYQNIQAAPAGLIESLIPSGQSSTLPDRSSSSTPCQTCGWTFIGTSEGLQH
ncbi:hypothetical protein THAOC_31995 [Thalassiosira oceanica]|uniref:Uncharacterized protein n=1 Tax=Thalassiosira oceanica TaxID=159749 RepID=K0R703_THAOC|nr:hypothetical protein THAOC_31995 [Thalassiosira oceanica]|eukprot:EJK49158.1 hypothetical protein THAOC_31995 [Thalassiosira oceanica]